MPISKVIYDNRVLIDLTGDTVTADTLKKGITAHRMDGEPIVGTMEGGGSSSTDDVDCILMHGFNDGTREFGNDGSVTARDSQGRTLVRTFSDEFRTCTSVLTDAAGKELGRMVKTYEVNPLNMTITDRHGVTRTKSISYTNNSTTTTLTPV